MHRRAILRMTAAMVLAGISRAHGAACRNTGSFERWLEEFKREAASQGISQRAIAAAAPYLVYDQKIVNIDRGQKIFQQDFLQFSSRMLAGDRLTHGAAEMRKYQPIFSREEQDYGVPAAVITSFWGLESDFGSNMGKYQALY